MPLIAKEPEGRAFTPAPEGIHVAACCDVVDLGVLDAGFGEKPYCEIRWQLEDTDDTGRRFVVRRRYTVSLNEKAALRRDLETWRGRKFTKDELRGFDVEQVIGKPCQVQIAHKLSEQGKTFANVTAVIPLGKGQASPGVTDYTREVERPRVDPHDEAPF